MIIYQDTAIFSYLTSILSKSCDNAIFRQFPKNFLWRLMTCACYLLVNSKGQPAFHFLGVSKNRWDFPQKLRTFSDIFMFFIGANLNNFSQFGSWWVKNRSSTSFSNFHHFLTMKSKQMIGQNESNQITIENAAGRSLLSRSWPVAVWKMANLWWVWMEDDMFCHCTKSNSYNFHQKQPFGSFRATIVIPNFSFISHNVRDIEV